MNTDNAIALIELLDQAGLHNDLVSLCARMVDAGVALGSGRALLRGAEGLLAGLIGEALGEYWRANESEERIAPFGEAEPLPPAWLQQFYEYDGSEQ